MHGKLKMLTNLWSEILKRREILLYLGVEWWIILKWLIIIGGINFGIDSLG